MMDGVEQSLFEEVAEVLRGMLPRDLGTLRQRPRRYGIKVWFGPETPPREHYEAQVIGADHVDDARVLALEVGFHSEHPKVDDNEAVLDQLLAVERKWRKAIGK